MRLGTPTSSANLETPRPASVRITSRTAKEGGTSAPFCHTRNCTCASPNAALSSSHSASSSASRADRRRPPSANRSRPPSKNAFFQLCTGGVPPRSWRHALRGKGELCLRHDGAMTGSSGPVRCASWSRPASRSPRWPGIWGCIRARWATGSKPSVGVVLAAR